MVELLRRQVDLLGCHLCLRDDRRRDHRGRRWHGRQLVGRRMESTSGPRRRQLPAAHVDAGFCQGCEKSGSRIDGSSLSLHDHNWRCPEDPCDLGGLVLQLVPRWRL